MSRKSMRRSATTRDDRRATIATKRIAEPDPHLWLRRFDKVCDDWRKEHPDK